MREIPDIYLDIMSKYLERKRVRFLNENAKLIADSNQIMFRNWILAVIGVLQENVKKSIKWIEEKYNDLTRNKIQPTKTDHIKRRG